MAVPLLQGDGHHEVCTASLPWASPWPCSVTVAVAEDKAAVKSGPQVGEELAGPFHPLNVNGAKAGEKNCLYCANGANPVAMVFARETSPELTKLDQEARRRLRQEHATARWAASSSSAPTTTASRPSCKKLAKDADLKKVVLSIDNPAGPEGLQGRQGRRRDRRPLRRPHREGQLRLQEGRDEGQGRRRHHQGRPDDHARAK